MSDYINAIRIVDKLMGDDSLTLDNIEEKISQESGAHIEQILGRSRKREIICLREALYYLYRERFKLSYPKIANLTNRSDHTTIMNGVHTFAMYLEKYAKTVS